MNPLRFPRSIYPHPVGHPTEERLDLLHEVLCDWLTPCSLVEMRWDDRGIGIFPRTDGLNGGELEHPGEAAFWPSQLFAWTWKAPTGRLLATRAWCCCVTPWVRGGTSVEFTGEADRPYILAPVGVERGVRLACAMRRRGLKDGEGIDWAWEASPGRMMRKENALVMVALPDLEVLALMPP